MSRRKSRSDNHPVMAIGDVLPSLEQSLDLAGRAGDMALFRLWETLMPSPYRDLSRLQRVERQSSGGTRLHVRVADAPSASAISFELDRIKEALNGFSPQTGHRVAEFRLTVGSLERLDEGRG